MVSKIIVISAPSGGGKTSLIDALLKRETQLQSVITHTTRSRREGEIDNLHYHFVSPLEFKNLIQQNVFIEWAEICDHYYGTSKTAVEKVWQAKKTPIINLDWQGAGSVRSAYPNQVTTIFILPPDLKALEQRLLARGDLASGIKKRLRAATKEMAHVREYDHVITNDDFETALSELQNVISHLGSV